MAEHHKPYNPETEFYFKEGCHLVETSNSVDDGQLSIAHARVEPGQGTRWHYLQDTFERYVILEGEALVEVGASEPTQVKPGDVVLIPPQTRQRITNTGDSDLRFLAICSPRFSHRNYYSIE